MNEYLDQLKRTAIAARAYVEKYGRGPSNADDAKADAFEHGYMTACLAVMHERETCSKIVESFPDSERIAAEIRAQEPVAVLEPDWAKEARAAGWEPKV